MKTLIVSVAFNIVLIVLGILGFLHLNSQIKHINVIPKVNVTTPASKPISLSCAGTISQNLSTVLYPVNGANLNSLEVDGFNITIKGNDPVNLVCN